MLPDSFTLRGETRVTERLAPLAVAALCLAFALATQMAAGISQNPNTAGLFSNNIIASVMKLADDRQSAHPVMPDGNRNWGRATWYTDVTAAFTICV